MIRVRIGDGFRAAWVRPEDVAHVSGVQLPADGGEAMGCRLVMADGSEIVLEIGPDEAAHQLGWMKPNPRAKR